MDLKEYPDLFEINVYQCYLPDSLRATKNYFKQVVANSVSPYGELREHLDNHPVFESTSNCQILDFDSNFECGNLNSAYLISPTSYNLLIRPDSNAKMCNSYWFYFKVSKMEVGKSYKFTILNIGRNFEKFYRQGMNVMTRIETDADSRS